METLSANELALAQKAVQLNLAWWKQNGKGGEFQRRDIAALSALNIKLDKILDAAFPLDECIDDSKADEPLMARLAIALS